MPTLRRGRRRDQPPLRGHEGSPPPPPPPPAVVAEVVKRWRSPQFEALGRGRGCRRTRPSPGTRAMRGSIIKFWRSRLSFFRGLRERSRPASAPAPLRWRARCSALAAVPISEASSSVGRSSDAAADVSLYPWAVFCEDSTEPAREPGAHRGGPCCRQLMGGPVSGLMGSSHDRAQAASGDAESASRQGTLLLPLSGVEVVDCRLTQNRSFFFEAFMFSI